MTLISGASSLRHLRMIPVAALFLVSHAVFAQTAGSNPAVGTADRSASYYHYGLARLYEDMAVNAGRSDYATQAVEEYKLALDADPDSRLLQDGLADLYFKIGRIREAVTAAQEQLAKTPDDVEAHTLLGKVYLRSLGDMSNPQSGKMLQLAIGEYEELAKLKPNDVETRLLLGQLYDLNHDSLKAEAEFKAAQKIDPNSEEVALNMARLYSEQGEPSRAAQVLSGIPVDDRSPRVEFSLGASYEQMKKYKDAVAAYHRALDMEPDNLDTERGLANALLADNQLDEALKVLNSIVAAEPQDAQSQIHISEIERRKGQYDLALKTLEKAKPLAPDSLELVYNEALVYDALGRYDDAEGVLTKLLAGTAHADGKYTDSEKSNRAIFLDRLGIIYREQNKTTDAVATYRQMIPLGGDYTKNGYQGVIDSYRDAHDWAGATAAAAEVAKAMPIDHGIQLMYAGQLADVGRADEGIALAKQQVGMTTGTAEERDSRMALAQIYIRLKKWPEAQAELEKMAPLSKSSDDKWTLDYTWGTLYDGQKRYDESEAEFRKALAISPQNPLVLNNLGYMFADRGVKLTEALTMIQKAVELDPQNGAFLDSLGWAYYKSGQYALAEQNLLKAAQRINTDPTVHDHLGEVYEKTGNLKAAVAQWERSMAEYQRSLSADADPADVAKVQRKLESARIKLAKAATPAK